MPGCFIPERGLSPRRLVINRRPNDNRFSHCDPPFCRKSNQGKPNQNLNETAKPLKTNAFYFLRRELGHVQKFRRRALGARSPKFTKRTQASAGARKYETNPRPCSSQR